MEEDIKQLKHELIGAPRLDLAPFLEVRSRRAPGARWDLGPFLEVRHMAPGARWDLVAQAQGSDATRCKACGRPNATEIVICNWNSIELICLECAKLVDKLIESQKEVNNARR